MVASQVPSQQAKSEDYMRKYTENAISPFSAATTLTPKNLLNFIANSYI